MSPSPSRILVVEDDPKTAASVRLYLEHAGFQVVSAVDGKRALELARSTTPNLIVLDLMLPGLGGLEICRRLREESSIPIIMLTARSTEEDRLLGLDLGADDYVVKPFSPRELAARVRAVLRRVPGDGETGPPIRVGGIVIDPARHEVTVRGRRADLTPREFRLLQVFARAPGRAFTRSELVELAFGVESEALDRTIDAHIVNLRRKIELDPVRPALIETVYGVGYRLKV